MNKLEYPRTVTSVQSLMLNYQPNYSYNRHSRSKGVSNQLMFTQHGKTREEKGDGKDKEQIPGRNLDHINRNNCGEKVHYAGKSECSTQTNLK